MAVQHFGTIANAAHDLFVRKLSDQTLRYHVAIGMMNAKGRIEYGADGTQLTWPIKFKRNTLNTYQDAQEVVFTRKQPYKRATLDWRAYDMNDVVTELELLQTRSRSALFKLYEQKERDIQEDFLAEFNGQFFQTGADGLKMQGIHSIFSSVTHLSAAVEATHSGTYGGLDQTLGAYGGSSVADPEYTFWTPTVLTWNSSAWFAGAGPTFRSNAFEVFRYGITRTFRRNNKAARVDYITLCIDWYTKFLNAFEDKEQIYTTKGGDKTVASLGFEAINFDGVELTWEEDVPDNQAFGVNVDQMGLKVLGDELVTYRHEWDVRQKAYLLDVGIYGNFWFNPQHHFMVGEK